MSNEKQTHKFFIYYANGHIEVVPRINVLFLHMVEIGLIKVIISAEENKAWIPAGDGTNRQITITSVTGLDS
jgi:hypothetical protein